MNKAPILAMMLLAVSGWASEIPQYMRQTGENSPAKSEIEFHEHARSHARIGGMQSKIIRRPYDVLGYNLYMDWTGPLSKQSVDSAGLPVILPQDRRYSGVNRIHLRIDSANVFAITLNAGNMSIDSVVSSGGQRLLSTQPENETFQVILSSLNPKPGDTLSFSVYYTFKGISDKGFYLYPKGMYIGSGPAPKFDSIFVEERLAYTMSEPQDARYWMPCNDQPDDKVRATISVRVPEGFQVSSNGLLTNTVTGDSATTFTWSDTTQITTYLMVVHASKFAQFTDWYHRVSNPSDSIPVMYYVWARDYEDTATDGSEYNARHAFRNTVKMMEEFSGKLVEYPFVKYGMTAIQPFNFGGMEHQTMTSVLRVWLRGRDENGIAHELMHQWTGDYVTCATWADLWLNEGGASWGEALWNELAYSKEGYKKVMDARRFGYMARGFTAPPIYGQPMNELFLYATTYAKSSWVYHMLRQNLGDSVFFPWFRAYFNEFAYQSIETEDMIASLEKHVGNPSVPFRTFFDQWVYAKGHPVYNVTVQNLDPAGSATNRVRITVRQTQEAENVPDAFVMPLQIELLSSDGRSYIVERLNNSREQVFELNTDFTVHSAFVDPDDRILCVKSSTVLAFDGTNVAESLNENIYEARILPNPVLSSSPASFRFSVSRPANVVVDLYSTLGEKIAHIHNARLDAGAYALPVATGELSSGAYILRMSVDGVSQSYTFNVTR